MSLELQQAADYKTQFLIKFIYYSCKNVIMDWRPFLYSVVISIILMGSLGYYENLQLTHIVSNLEAKITDLKDAQNTIKTDLSAVSTDLTTTKEELGLKVSEVQKGITDVKTQSEQNLNSLTGQLQTVQQQSQQQIDSVKKQISNINIKSSDFTEIAQRGLESTVVISTDVGTGSGAFIKDGGYIVTNYHVISGATKGGVKTNDGKVHAMRIVGSNQNKDIAVIQIQENYPVLEFGNSDNVEAGNKVIAIGSPSGLEFTVTEGIVSAVHRTVEGNTYIQTDVPINPGNSGGPLIDIRGQIIGINTKKVANTEGLGLSIESNIVKPIVDSIIQQDLDSQNA